jgi:hypothetical protein
MPSSITACATWIPNGPYSRAMLWLIIRRPAFAAAKYPLMFAHFDRLIEHEHFRQNLKPYVEKLLSKTAA